MYGRTSILDDLKKEFSSGNVISQLIMINIAVFLILNLINVVAFLFYADRQGASMILNKVLAWIMLPADIGDLITRPWTLFTHMFAHYGFLHLLFNMLWLYWFGRIIQEFIGNKKVLPLYILGGLTGAILLIISYNIFPGLQSAVPYVKALGASAGVLAIVVGAATLVPNYSVYLLFFGSVKIKYIAILMVLLDMVSIPDLNTGGHIAHLGGALFGFIFIKQLQLGNDWSKPFYNIINAVGNAFNLSKKPRVVHRKKRRRTQVRVKSQAEDYSQGKQERIDAILDKIARSGYDSLSKEEKEFLFRVSKED